MGLTFFQRIFPQRFISKLRKLKKIRTDLFPFMLQHKYRQRYNKLKLFLNYSIPNKYSKPDLSFPKLNLSDFKQNPTYANFLHHFKDNKPAFHDFIRYSNQLRDTPVQIMILEGLTGSEPVYLNKDLLETFYKCNFDVKFVNFFELWEVFLDSEKSFRSSQIHYFEDSQVTMEQILAPSSLLLCFDFANAVFAEIAERQNFKDIRAGDLYLGENLSASNERIFQIKVEAVFGSGLENLNYYYKTHANIKMKVIFLII